MPEPLTIRILPCLVLLFICGFFRVQSQTLPREILFERIAIPGTIRSSQISNIIQDESGMIWLTGSGLYRYDGLRFHQYRELGSGREFLTPQDLLFIFNDSISDRILVGTSRFGIVSYTYKHDRLIPLQASENSPVINHLAQTNDGKIWAASFNNGLYFLEDDSLKKIPDPQKLFVHPGSMIAAGSKLYVGELGKVLIMEESKIKAQISLSWQGTDLPFYTQVTALHLDRSQKLWIGTEKQGVLVYDLIKEKFIHYFPPSQTPFFNKITQIHQDREGLIWILTKASGVVVYSPSEEKMTHLTKDPFSAQSISSDNCFSITEDRQGIIWIGATGDLNKYDRKQIKFNHINHNPLRKLSLTDNMVRGVYEDSHGKVWIGTDGGYVNLLDPDKESIEQLKVKLKNDSANYVPLYFLEFNERIMLVGTSLGLLQYDRSTRTFSPYQPLWAITEKRTIRQLLRHKEALYFIYNGILFVHNLSSGQTELFRNGGDAEAINITAIHLDRQHRLWVGTNRGVSLFNPDKKTFTLIPFKKVPVGVDGSLLLVLSIEQIKDKIYAGTFNAGLWEVDIREIETSLPIPKNYTDRDGLPSNTVYSALGDDSGNLWLSTNNGLARFDPETRQVVSFAISEGVQEEEFNRLAYTKTKSGNMIFGGINGINIFNPADVPVEKENYMPQIISVSAGNPLVRDSSSLRITDIKRKLVFQYDQNFLSIHFFVPNYKQPKRYSLFCKLENFEKEWREVSNENNVTYANLQPGAYTFILKSVGSNGEESLSRLPFTVAAPYWKTWWFIFLSFCVVAFLVMTIIRSYIRKAQFDRDRLEELLKMRTSEIEKSKEQLQILNQKKDLIFSILSHDLRSPLTTLKGFLGYIIDHAEELTREELKKHAVNIRNSVTNSLDLIDNTLFWSLSQMGNIQYTPTNFPLQHLLEKLKGLYQLTADKKRIPLTISCHEDIILNGDENMIYVTLRNLVSNALKFTSEGNPVFITCASKDGFAEINVVDRGIGMSQDYLRKILSVDQPMLKKGTSNEKGTGLGLLLCKKFVEMNKGELQITSIENVGTTFTVTLPLGNRESVAVGSQQ
jgi:signal transduction histidine kinase/ligand-binding sensor domain-containing protein